MAALHIAEGPNAGRTIRLDGEEVVLGRARDCAVVLPENVVSKWHARIVRQGRHYLIQDLDSKGGTRLNQRLLRPFRQVKLHDGDMIRLCQYVLQFREQDPDRAIDRLPQPVVAFGADELAGLDGALPAERLRDLLSLGRAMAAAWPDWGKLFRALAATIRQQLPAAAGYAVVLDETPEDPDPAFHGDLTEACLETGRALLIGTARGVTQMAAPLSTSRSGPFGVLLVRSDPAAGAFSTDDLRRLAALAAAAGPTLGTALQHRTALERSARQRDDRFAAEIQRGLLPEQFPAVPDYQFHAHYDAAQSVGGDYYDFLRRPGGKWAVLLGDVAGKGVPAALLMARLATEVRYTIPTAPDLATAIARLNDRLADRFPPGRFVTLVALELDPAWHTVTCVNAGHPAPLIFRRAGGSLGELGSQAEAGYPLGVVKGDTYAEATARLEPGDAVLLFTDGVTEAMNPAGDQFRVEGIHQALREGHTPDLPWTPQRLVRRVAEAVRRHVRGRPPSDDVALVCFGRQAPEMGELEQLAETDTAVLDS